MSAVGIVAVSHSLRLAEAAQELAAQMVPGGTVPIVLAAGAGEDAGGAPILGTDATRVAAAIDELAAVCDGVLVLMDLGSAVMSAEFALELRASEVPVRLASAPFVEGLLAASVTAAQGASLDEVAAEANGALIAKSAQLGDEPQAPAGSGGPELEESAPASAVSRPGEGVRTVLVRNPAGVHARPAALIAQAAAGAELRLRRLPDGDPVPASSMMRLLAFGARPGDEVQLAGDPAAVERVAALFEDGFGEMDGPPSTSGSVSEDARSATETRRGALASDGVSTRSARSTTPASLSPGSTLRGLGVSPGRAIAPVAQLGAAIPEPPAGRLPAAGREAEAERIPSAAVEVVAALRAAAAGSDGEAVQILEATALLAADPEFAAGAAARVRAEGVSAARAVWDEAADQEQVLRGLGGRLAERAVDVRSVRDRIVARLTGQEVPGIPERADPFVLVARDLAPAETATLGRSRCAGLVTEEGGPTSHTAILARALGIPAVVGVAGAVGIAAGTTVLVDGEAGIVRLDPPAGEAVVSADQVPAFDGTGLLADGTAIPLLANVGGAADAVAAAAAGAQGVGLFRTEFCFLDRAEEPTVAEQVAAYRGVLAPFAGRKVVVRTLDAGSDKPLPFATATDEENPALGVRGLRVAREHPALLAHQLAAIAAAGAAEGAQLEVMAPMVATVDEARDFAAACRAAGIVRAGIMIETPAAALLASELLAVVDFVSLGTNDLTQYTLAADRLSAPLGALNDPWQPAVLRLIAAVGEAGRAADKPVGVCGEAGGDPALAPILVGLGVTSLSMTARSLARVSARLRALTADDCRRAAAAALGAPTATEARAAAAAALG
ncbi:MAG: phosphoenolpyruvate--protein phosphotransferase [Microbacterium sp.]|jgi:phosphotransferase system enzyme I (PtsI)|uniref:phosphoenolpyruvate--protein phosphotransferase n=1 Tax=Microbacterium sp. TaxID=51671 RepID=UPI002817EDFF|nr:phosphoenolpyruvate--protein phosphotransferase [Microbacterium sp.]MDR2321243.1 phosphoenolpyruvate--protein phosphotransferase [Microbacterium sp.]